MQSSNQLAREPSNSFSLNWKLPTFTTDSLTQLQADQELYRLQNEPEGAAQIQTRLLEIEQILSQFDNEKYPRYYNFYKEEIYKYEEKLRNLLPPRELTDEEKANLHQRYKRQQTMYDRMCLASDSKEIKKRLKITQEIKDQILTTQEYEIYVKFYSKKQEYMEQKLQKIKSKIEQQVENLQRQKKRKKQYQKFREPENQEQIEERVEDILQFLQQVPKGTDFQEFKEFYLKQLEEYEAELEYFIEHGKRRKFNKHKISAKLQELKRLRKGYKKFKVPQTSEQVQDRINDLKEFLEDIPEEVEEFKEYKDYFEEELEKWNASYQIYLKDEQETKEAKEQQNKEKKKILSDLSESDVEFHYEKAENQQHYVSPSSSDSDSLIMKRRSPARKLKSVERDSRQLQRKKQILDKYIENSQEQLSGIMKLSVEDKQFKRKKLNKEYNAYTLRESEDEDFLPKKKSIIDSSSDSSLSPRVDRNSRIKLGCNHTFRTSELKKWIEKRTDGLVITIKSDKVGQKFFKCAKCYYLITKPEIERIFGKERYFKLCDQATMRLAKLFDSAGNLSKEEKKEKMSCMLCDANTKTKANHDDHYFCKDCWQGVNKFYNGNFGCCGGQFCTFFNKSVTNTSLIYWIEEKSSK